MYRIVFAFLKLSMEKWHLEQAAAIGASFEKLRVAARDAKSRLGLPENEEADWAVEQHLAGCQDTLLSILERSQK